jgi:hypothetical protein
VKDKEQGGVSVNTSERSTLFQTHGSPLLPKIDTVSKRRITERRNIESRNTKHRISKCRKLPNIEFAIVENPQEETHFHKSASSNCTLVLVLLELKCVITIGVFYLLIVLV